MSARSRRRSTRTASARSSAARCLRRAAIPTLVIEQLIAAVEPALVASAGPRYYGFVVGGALEAATRADILAAGWDQMAFNSTSSPVAFLVEEIVGGWLKEALALPPDASFGLVTGAQGANTVALAAARHRVLSEAAWDVEADGLAGAPAVRVLAGEERHATIDRSLRLLGLGAHALEPVAAGGNGAIEWTRWRARSKQATVTPRSSAPRRAT